MLTAAAGREAEHALEGRVRHANGVAGIDDHHAFVQQLEHARLGFAQVLRGLAVGDLGDVDHGAGDAALGTNGANARIERTAAVPVVRRS